MKKIKINKEVVAVSLGVVYVFLRFAGVIGTAPMLSGMVMGGITAVLIFQFLKDK